MTPAALTPEVIAPPVYLEVGEQIFRRFPGYVRGVVVAAELTNGPSGDELHELLRAEEEALRHRAGDTSPASWPEVASWREAFRSFGASPGKFRCSLEALSRRVLKGSSLPTIHRLVDIANLVSLRHRLPVGGHALEEVRSPLRLRFSRGGETFEPLGDPAVEVLSAGEVIYAEGDRVLTRRWAWRQGKHTILTPESRSVEFNLDGLPPVSERAVRLAGEELMSLLARFCGGRFRFEILTAERPRVPLFGGEEH